jgi:hypothetical protein
MIVKPMSREDVNNLGFLSSCRVKDGPGDYNSDCIRMVTSIHEACIPDTNGYWVVAYPDPTFSEQAVVVTMTGVPESSQLRLKQALVDTPGYSGDWMTIHLSAFHSQGDYENKWTAPEE